MLSLRNTCRLTSINSCSNCGYSHEAAGSKKRRKHWEFTGCLVHVEVRRHSASGAILRVSGYFKHNEACQHAKCSLPPDLPLHPMVMQHSQEMLREGIPIARIRQRNEDLYEKCAYPGMPTTDDEMVLSKYRWLMKTSDHCSLYRAYARSQGIDLNQDQHVNLHEWLQQDSPHFNQTLANGVFHYKPRTKKQNRLEIGVATPEMRDAAWKYGHNSQILMDGTFGISSARMLLFIVMALDEDWKGVPLAFFIFSAPGDSKQTAAGYNTEILTLMLRLFANMLGSRDGVTFCIRVVITDTDMKERKALSKIFPGIILILCKFHLRQCWSNHLNMCLTRPSTDAVVQVRIRVKDLEAELLRTTDFAQAKELVAREHQFLETVSSNNGAAGTAIPHLEYLLGFWLASESLWYSWSAKSTADAAKILSCPPDKVLNTTNHLESFNNVLKNIYLQNRKRGGRKMRVDVVTKLFVEQVLPEVYRKR